jgi:serine/threonine-protein phosphatase PGAM5
LAHVTYVADSDSYSCSVLGRLGAFSIEAAHSDVPVQSLPENELPAVTGAAYSFTGATTSLTSKILTPSKKITLVRHGLSSWNAESRVQVNFCQLFSLQLLINI